ncbi:MAG: alkaline phosphatase family protein [Phycisphaerae bacterium]|nr:alkaline phosphatase family protein [Phycisphaerae bacterium]MDW8263108.1 alkaline phosphatase family protein [Phycisphaerales bacterium]
MRRTIVLNVVGLTRALIQHMPWLSSWAQRRRVCSIGHVTPAVTCSVQATYLTGCTPQEHGIVGNGWYDRQDCEIKFWKQSDRLVQRPRIWELGRQRDPKFSCANLFWWYAMYSTADVTVTPRPMYPADGRKIPDVWTHPPDLRQRLQERLGQFPLFSFWGPRAGIESSRWIAQAASVLMHDCDLTLIYLPHLDYALQKYGPNSPESAMAARETDSVVSELLATAEERGYEGIVLSEYGIEPVSKPVHLNREFRELGLLQVRTELGRELLDAGASRAFAVADHQVAHVYVNDPSALPLVQSHLSRLPGVAQVFVGETRRQIDLDHPRAGDLVVIAEPGAWFTYYFWLDDARAPDFARTVDIHRKPGYDPVELFLDPARPFIHAQVAWKLLKRKLGFRTLLDVIPLDASLVKGSHGRPPVEPDGSPVLISARSDLLESDLLEPTAICRLILRHVFD